VIQAPLVEFESSWDNFHLSPTIDEGFGHSGSKDSKVSTIGNQRLHVGSEGNPQINTYQKVKSTRDDKFPDTHFLGFANEVFQFAEALFHILGQKSQF
jgi:hypothetical protein